MIALKTKIGEYTCTECFKKVEVIIKFQIEITEQFNIWICKECLEKALTLINKESENV